MQTESAGSPSSWDRIVSRLIAGTSPAQKSGSRPSSQTYHAGFCRKQFCFSLPLISTLPSELSSFKDSSEINRLDQHI